MGQAPALCYDSLFFLNTGPVSCSTMGCNYDPPIFRLVSSTNLSRRAPDYKVLRCGRFIIFHHKLYKSRHTEFLNPLYCLSGTTYLFIFNKLYGLLKNATTYQGLYFKS